jgi:predicted transcriptional regulator
MLPRQLHELESEVMEELWGRGERTVREVLEALNTRRTPQRAYTTILTVMQRLHDKGLLRREWRGGRHVYVPALSRDEFAEAQVGALVSEYGDVALAQFARAVSRLDPKRREEIRKLAEDD